MKEKYEEDFFKDIMSKSKLELPFPDFEDTVMMEIKTQELSREIYSTNIKRSWACFIAGTIFGIILSAMLPQFQLSLFGKSSDSLLLVFQFIFTLFVLFSLESLIRNTRKIGMNNLFNNKLSTFNFLDNG
ncbi:MAG: hypothetical protein WD604_17940 [Balneolaceae bacterium]